MGTGESEIRSFEDLDCYKAARNLRRRVSHLCKSLPREEEYRLKDQITRSARSISANIAEGFGRHHHQENLQFCRQARGSLTETLEHLNVALDEGYLPLDQYHSLRAEWETGIKILNGYIAYIQRCANEAKRQ